MTSSEGVDPLFFTVARISTYDDPKIDKVWNYGTGFFYLNPRKQLFLITNRHLILDEEKGYIPNVARLSFHANPNDLRVNRDYDIPLYSKGSRRLWKEPKPFADLVSIPLEVKVIQSQGLILKSFSDANLLPADLRLQVGEDILVMGYPLAHYYDDVFNLPVVRNGIVASAYPMPFKGQPYFLIDARLHKGTSGSLVMTKSKRSWRKVEGGSIVGNFQFFLLGVNSSTWQLPKDVEPLGINTAAFASIIQDITR
jgi:hypothetical protein